MLAVEIYMSHSKPESDHLVAICGDNLKLAVLYYDQVIPLHSADVIRAIGYLKDAIRLDPDYGAAYNSIVVAYSKGE